MQAWFAEENSLKTFKSYGSVTGSVYSLFYLRVTITGLINLLLFHIEAFLFCHTLILF